MSLDFSLHEERRVCIFDRNITHNLTEMAREAGLYNALWSPHENGLEKATQLIPILEAGLLELETRPNHYRQYNPENGWGDYESFVRFVRAVLVACQENPNSEIEADV